MTQTATSRSGIACILGDTRGAVVGPYGTPATGLAMQADPDGEGFHLVLVSGTNALMALGPFAEEDVVAEWRALSAKTGLPLMVRLTNGSVLTLMAQIGNVRIGSAEPNNRKVMLAARRPRFLACRKSGRMQAMVVNSSEIDPLEGRQG